MATLTITIEGRGETVTEQITIPDDLLTRTYPDNTQDLTTHRVGTLFTKTYVEWNRRWRS